MTPKTTRSFSIGICASDSASNLLGLLRIIENESFSAGLILRRIIVVASGCPRSVLSEVGILCRADPRILLMPEPKRRGKVEAVNKIISNQEGEFLVLVNSDAEPTKGSISRLLDKISSSDDIGSVSALPVMRSKKTVTQKVLDLMWSAHNISSLELNHARLSNHNCDELMVVRTKLVPGLPKDVVNDGAYIGGLVFEKGYRVVLCDDSKVTIDVPTRISDLIQQRRRILFGHARVWKDIGRPPRTIESLLLMKPRLALRLIGEVMISKPSLLLVMPIAAITEAMAGGLSMLDGVLSPTRHVVWKRYGGPSDV